MYLDFQTFQQEYLNLDDFKIIEDNDLFFLWKKAGIPSSFWKEKSVLDLLEENYFDKKFTENQKKYFSKENEFWLLNRLDNDTSGFLYFAKDLEIYKKFKELQKNEKIEKIYYAKVAWWFEWFQNDAEWWIELSLLDQNYHIKSFVIDFPIMHKNKTKMIAIKDKKDTKKWRWKQHFVKTFVEMIEYDKVENTSWLKIIIKKWIRHQIRCHLASVGLAIVWDKLYWWKDSEKLYLFSVGTM